MYCHGVLLCFNAGVHRAVMNLNHQRNDYEYELLTVV